jgi:hypothetical protein
MGGDDAFVAELIDQFVTDSPALVAAARAGSRPATRRGPPSGPHAQVERRDVRRQRARRPQQPARGRREGRLAHDGPAQLEAIDDELARVHAALRASVA